MEKDETEWVLCESWGYFKHKEKKLKTKVTERKQSKKGMQIVWASRGI